METFDSAKAARVWQRVRGEAEETPRHQGLMRLIAEEWTDAAICTALSRRFQGKQAQLLRRMSEEEQAHAACLKGIYTLLTGERPTVKAVPLSQESTEAILRRCYGTQMRRLAEYEARSEDPEYGKVYEKLADQEQSHCHQILALLGSLKRK